MFKVSLFTRKENLREIARTSADPEVLKQVMKYKYRESGYAGLRENPNMTPELLLEARVEAGDVRWGTALESHPNYPKYMLTRTGMAYLDMNGFLDTFEGSVFVKDDVSIEVLKYVSFIRNKPYTKEQAYKAVLSNPMNYFSEKDLIKTINDKVYYGVGLDKRYSQVMLRESLLSNRLPKDKQFLQENIEPEVYSVKYEQNAIEFLASI